MYNVLYPVCAIYSPSQRWKESALMATVASAVSVALRLFASGTGEVGQAA